MFAISASFLAMELLLNYKIRASCQANMVPSISSNDTNNKNELCKTVRLTNFQRQKLRFVSIFLKIVHPWLPFYLLYCLYLLFMFVKLRDTAPSSHLLFYCVTPSLWMIWCPCFLFRVVTCTLILMFFLPVLNFRPAIQRQSCIRGRRVSNYQAGF